MELSFFYKGYRAKWKANMCVAHTAYPVQFKVHILRPGTLVERSISRRVEAVIIEERALWPVTCQTSFRSDVFHKHRKVKGKGRLLTFFFRCGWDVKKTTLSSGPVLCKSGTNLLSPTTLSFPTLYGAKYSRRMGRLGEVDCATRVLNMHASGLGCQCSNLSDIRFPS